ncbi:hypothetical protein EDB83DRAFT_2323230 [Lactarius deliciosus]|nr:hypothetical protein EDB83DRAFT_2323230 [Lactarius deliciosus]
MSAVIAIVLNPSLSSLGWPFTSCLGQDMQCTGGPRAPPMINYKSTTTCLKSADTASSCTNTTGRRQHPANAATTSATAMGGDGGNTTMTGLTMGECPSIRRLGNARRPPQKTTIPIDYDNGAMPIDLRRRGDGQRQRRVDNGTMPPASQHASNGQTQRLDTMTLT